MLHSSLLLTIYPSILLPHEYQYVQIIQREISIQISLSCKMFPRLPKLNQFLVLSPATGTKTSDNLTSPSEDAEKSGVPIQRLSSTSSTDSAKSFASGFLKLGSDRSWTAMTAFLLCRCNLLGIHRDQSTMRLGHEDELATNSREITAKTWFSRKNTYKWTLTIAEACESWLPQEFQQLANFGKTFKFDFHSSIHNFLFFSSQVSGRPIPDYRELEEGFNATNYTCRSNNIAVPELASSQHHRHMLTSSNDVLAD